MSRGTWRTISASAAALVALATGIALEPPSAAQSAISAAGVVESTSGGFRFPDGSVQLTAAGGQSTVVVSPIGTASENGTALLDALDGITTNSAATPFLLKLEPGVYDLGTSSLVMKAFVDIEGSGQGVTRIVAAVSSSISAAVQAATDAELRHLTVENVVASGDSKAIRADGVTMRLTAMTARSSGGTGSTNAIDLVDGSDGILTDVTAIAQAAGGVARGVLVAESTVLLSRVTARASGGTSNFALGMTDATGTIADTTLMAIGGSTARGIFFAFNSGPNGGTILDSTIVATDATTENSGIQGTNSGTSVVVHHSLARGATRSVGPGLTAQIGASQLDGPTAGTLTCAASYDGAFAELDATCS
jgi:hypothetical protein